MEGNLLSAPRPEYPASARTAHIEGTVTLEATISRSGSVKTLHAIKGPRLLRSAAIDAVRDWRYKPYSVDGRTVEVATTVYVDFSLKQPTIAH
jgi:protein TonB